MSTEQGKTSRKKVIETIVIPETGKIQPQALEIEKVVLGALMLERDAYSSVSELLRKECFYDKKHELIFEAIVDLVKTGRPVDMLTVIEQLKKN
jgi:replicative DNA helicase